MTVDVAATGPAGRLLLQAADVLSRQPWSLQVAAVLVVLAISAGVARRTRKVSPRTNRDLRAAFGIRVVPSLTAAVIALAAGTAFNAMGQPATVLFACALLAALLAMVRAALCVLARLIGADRAPGMVERIVGYVVWSLAIVYLMGWTQPLFESADALSVPLGRSRLSVLDALRVLALLIVFLVGAAYLGTVVERRLMAFESLSIGVRVGASKVARVLLVVAALVLSLDAAGIDLTMFAVIGGAVGVGLGFGLQRIASNFVSGFVLLGDRSIRPGDVITIGSRFGVVRDLRARYVVVRDRDGVDTLIPNENIITSEVINWSYGDRQIRLNLPVQIS